MNFAKFIIGFSVLAFTIQAFGMSPLARDAYQKMKAGDFDSARIALSANEIDGDPDALFLLGMIYDEGKGIEKDQRRAGELYMEAGKLGHPIAQLFLGNFYKDGIGFEKSLDKAIFWLSKSAERGNSHAQRSLGFIYASEEKKDEKQAIYWLMESAKQGNTQAMGMLAALLAQKEDQLSEAYAWSNLAAKYDPIQRATSTRFAIESYSSPEQIAEGKRLLVQFEQDIHDRFNKATQAGTP